MYCIRLPKKIKPVQYLNQDALSNIATYEYKFNTNEKNILNFVNSTNELLEQMTSHEILKNMDIKNINIPRIVVVGTQSSGKSSIINKMIGYDILPIGENMVTRTPINIKLNHVSNYNQCISSIYIFMDGNKEIIYTSHTDKINLTIFQNKIMEATNRLTDNNYSISNSQIFIEINSLEVENLNIIDLAGIVNISLTDKGQPETIVEDIKNLIIEQLQHSETYVLAVISSLVDLEADSGLALIKTLQRKNDKLRAVGVLTKPDRLKNYSKLNDIINNKISKNLMLDDGYFVVNNLGDDYWYSQTFGINSDIIKKRRYGITNLKNHLKKP